MLGTPNKGAEVADILRDWHLYRLILGPAGQQLVADQAGVIAKLPVPKIPFAVIAGGKGTKDGCNPLIPGDDDGLVAAIAQDWQSGEVLMMAWMNAEALDLTLSEMRAEYFSRSRKSLWRKGEESGNVQQLKELYVA